MNRLEKILLIDDSESDNFVHERLLKKENVAKEIITKYSGEEALEYLSTIVEKKYPKPDLIFLDINMPGMNGWEFLEHYKDLEIEKKGGIVITMLTTSSSEEDRIKASQNPNINRFENKPLTKERLYDILEKHFPDRFTP
ncbi:response regulator [Altibacter sp.]|uniref:response regulator n=1 Tax=Altibacter sp. TaxID=2024823 RepID=UPI000C8BD36B|nr:response regulator [Altibacter sp.]MAP54249.1 response regulator [Altibacter sp.]|tara:strand:+ start:325 stop:744 length:420 start_codon:yes stop_codon:yes gene_type:complete